MSEFLEQAVAEMNSKMEGSDFDGSAKLAVADVGAIILDSSGARISDDDADVTLNADMDTFQQIFEGDLNPTSAFMSGKLSIDGDMGMAMKLAAVLG